MKIKEIFNRNGYSVYVFDSGDYYMILSIDYPSKTKTIIDTQCNDDEFFREVNAWANNEIRQWNK